jgi:hypothetical protein
MVVLHCNHGYQFCPWSRGSTQREHHASSLGVCNLTGSRIDHRTVCEYI